MSWKAFLSQGRAEPHRSNAAELGALRAVVQRHLADPAVTKISPDTRSACAYEAALPRTMPVKLCSVGAPYFNACRRLQYVLSPESADVIAEREAVGARAESASHPRRHSMI